MFEVDYYVRQLDEGFQTIIQSKATPRFKTEVESLRERLEHIRNCANQASYARYLKDAVPEVLLANLITQVLTETAELDSLKPLVSENSEDDFFEVLAGTGELKLDEALEGFEFFDNNPYKSKAERKLAKIRAKREKRMRG